jgi:hypothetical protein
VAVSVKPSIALSVSPPSANLAPHESLTFVASGGSGTGYTWVLVTNASGGTLSSEAFACRLARICYTAGATGNVTDELRLTDSLGASVTAVVNIAKALAVSPSSVTLEPRATQTFTASGGEGPYAWAFVTNASGGILDSAGAYTAGATGGVTDQISVTDALGTHATATVVVNVSALTISPSNVTLEPKARQNFTAFGGEGPYQWAFVTNASSGSLSAAGAYTAGPTGGVTDVVGVTDSHGAQVTATVRVTPSGGCGATGGSALPLLALALLPLLTARRRRSRLQVKVRF